MKHPRRGKLLVQVATVAFVNVARPEEFVSESRGCAAAMHRITNGETI